MLSGKIFGRNLYRGSWCPYCNTQLSEIASIEDELKKLGYQIVAISPDKPESLNVTETKHDLDTNFIRTAVIKPWKPSVSILIPVGVSYQYLLCFW